MRKLNISFKLWLCLWLLLGTHLVCKGQRPEPFVATGHIAPAFNVSFSPDGRTLASAGADGLRLWDVNTGTELRTVPGIDSFAFSPDGQVLATLGKGSGITLWHVDTGRKLRTIDEQDTVFSIAFNPDGKMLASVHSAGVKVWDVASVQPLRTLSYNPNPVHSVAFSPDGKMLAAGSKDNSIKVWDVALRKELKSLVGHTSYINSVAFSPGGETLASASNKETKLWEVASGRELQTLSVRAYSVAFSPNGEMIATASGSNLGATTIKLWDVASGKELRALTNQPFRLDYSVGYVGDFVAPLAFSGISGRPAGAVAFSPDGKMLAGGGGNAIRLWDVTTGEELRALAGHSNRPYALVLSPDGKKLAGAFYDATVKLLDTSAGTGQRILSGVAPLAFSPDSRTLASGSLDKRLTVWDAIVENSNKPPSASLDQILDQQNNRKVKLWAVATGTELRTLTGPASDLVSVAFSPDGKQLAAATVHDATRLWDVATGGELRTLEVIGGALAFSPDAKMVAVGVEGPSISLLDTANGNQLRTFKGYGAFAFSPDGKMLAGASPDQSVKLWDVYTGKEIRTLISSQRGSPFGCAFSHDGQTLACTDFGAITLWNVSTGAELRTLKGASSLPALNGLAFSPDGRMVVSLGPSGTAKLWDAQSGAEIASLFYVDDQDWMVVTPDGLFDGSPGAWNRIHWRLSERLRDVLPAEAFFNEFFYPGLLADIFAGKRPKATQDIAQKDRRQPTVKLSLAAVQTAAPTIASRSLKVQVEVYEAAPDAGHPKSGSGAQDVRLFRNGALVKVWRGDVLKGQTSTTLAAAVPIVAGENRLTAYTFNRDNIRSADATLTINGAESLGRKGTGYVVAVGVNRYAANPFFRNLRYAVADAEEFAAEVQRQQEQLARFAQVEVIRLTDNAATKANLLSALAALAKRAQPEDAVLVYFAGHGLARDGKFFLIPRDIGGGATAKPTDALAALDTMLAIRGISDRELKDAFEAIDAGQHLLVIDACNSGQALGGEKEGRGPMNAKGLAQLAYDKGMYILTAAQSFQAAQEVSQVGHGLLTYALVEEGLRRTLADDKPKDGIIFVREWLDYATQRVPRMQLDKMRQARGIGLNLSFKDDERGLDIEERSGQVPRVFYRRELEAQPFVIARPGTAKGQ